MYYLLLFLLLILQSCSSKEAKSQRFNTRGEYIFRYHNEFFFNPLEHEKRLLIKYPWDLRHSSAVALVTKEFFRCKGSVFNAPHVQIREGKETLYYYDCEDHGLPLRDGKEFIYPALIEILNYIQVQTGKQVVITSGHRCPKHNLYVDYSPSNWGSKHMLGAEVEFYVKDREKEPLEIIALIQKYYQETPPFSSSKAFTLFERFEKGGVNVSLLPWYNKEIFIKLYLEDEGRNSDNNHSFPYIGLQLRYDRDLDCKVTFDGYQAQNYLRN